MPELSIDEYDGRQRTLESAINSLPRDTALTAADHYCCTHQLAHEQAAELAEVVDLDNGQDAAEILHHHPIIHLVLTLSSPCPLWFLSMG